MHWMDYLTLLGDGSDVGAVRTCRHGQSLDPAPNGRFYGRESDLGRYVAQLARFSHDLPSVGFRPTYLRTQALNCPEKFSPHFIIRCVFCSCSGGIYQIKGVLNV